MIKIETSLLDQIRLAADYYVVGSWPDVVKGPLPEVFEDGQRYAVAIIALEN